MFKKKAALLVAVLPIVIVAGTGWGGTFAWLSTSKDVTNAFTVGKVDISVIEGVPPRGGKHRLYPFHPEDEPGKGCPDQEPGYRQPAG